MCDPRHNKLIEDGNKSNDDDAETLAQLLRMGAVKAVYKGDQQQRELKELCRAYDNLVEDATRAQNRLKAIYRANQRSTWLDKLCDQAARFRAASLPDQAAILALLRLCGRHQVER